MTSYSNLPENVMNEIVMNVIKEIGSNISLVLWLMPQLHVETMGGKSEIWQSSKIFSISVHSQAPAAEFFRCVLAGSTFRGDPTPGEEKSSKGKWARGGAAPSNPERNYKWQKKPVFGWTFLRLTCVKVMVIVFKKPLMWTPDQKKGAQTKGLRYLMDFDGGER